MITIIKLPTLINNDCKMLKETPENILFHTKPQNRAFRRSHLSLESSTNMTNLKARNLKSFDKYDCQQDRSGVSSDPAKSL
jgi:hypothetical protein